VSLYCNPLKGFEIQIATACSFLELKRHAKTPMNFDFSPEGLGLLFPNDAWPSWVRERTTFPSLRAFTLTARIQKAWLELIRMARDLRLA